VGRKCLADVSVDVARKPRARDKRKEGRERIGTLLRSCFMLVDVGKYCSREAVALEGAGSVPELPVAAWLSEEIRVRPYWRLGILDTPKLLNK
jgi:hypothetical protein